MHGLEVNGKGNLPKDAPLNHQHYVDEFTRKIDGKNPYHPEIDKIYEGHEPAIKGRPFEQCAETPTEYRFK